MGAHRVITLGDAASPLRRTIGLQARGTVVGMTAPTRDVLDVVERFQTWAREHHRLVDVLFALLTIFTACTELLGQDHLDGTREADVAGFALLAVSGAALVFRRSASIPVLVVVTVLSVVFYVRDYGTFGSILGLVPIYSVAVHTVNRRHAWLAIGGSASVYFVTASFTIFNGAGGYDYASAFGMCLYISAAAVVGSVVRNRQRLFADTERRAERAERDRLVAAERAVSQERIRIAREMHDVVAHGMSVITVQAAAAQSIVQTDADAAEGALAKIESVGRESLNELRRMLGVLRGDEPGTSDYAPQPQLRDLSKLVQHCIETGIQTELVTVGTERDLPPGLGLAVYRIVQEALTNVVKHAGASAEAAVTLRYTERALEIAVADTGRGAVSSLNNSGSGNGLMGMRERVEAYHGTFSAGPITGGGYRVLATLPTDESQVRPATSLMELSASEVHL